MYKQTSKSVEARKKKAVVQKPKPSLPKKKRKKVKWGEVILKVFIVVVLLAGVGMVSYPTVSNWYNQAHQSRAIASHVDIVEHMDDSVKQAILQEARVYNDALPYDKMRLLPDEADTARYNNLLNPSGDGVMGYLEIKKIKVKLAIYHGTSDAVLQTGVGHLEGTSLPIGGTPVHCLLSGHRGLPSATLFTHLDELEIGDTFQLHILGDTLTYQVDKIDVVLPAEVNNLTIDDGHDYVTLVTCTPYGVNSHRMLVRGTRIPTPEEDYEETVTPVGIVDIAGVETPLWVFIIPIAIILIVIMELIRRRTGKATSEKRKSSGGKTSD